MAQIGWELTCFWLPETRDSSLVLYKVNKMMKQLFKASGAAKQSKPLLSSCELSGDVLKWLSEALSRTGLGIKRQDVDLRIAS